MASGETIIVNYEQPLNEQMRLCLRLEHLFAQIGYHLERESVWDTRIIVSALLDVLSVVDRPDLKNKLAQILNQYIAVFGQLEQLHGVDKTKLKQITSQLNKAFDTLQSIHGRIGQELRENEFFIAIQQRSSTAAGTCAFNIPSYHLWLQRSPKIRLKNLLKSYEPFLPLQKIINLLLKLTRDSVELRTKIAKAGFYQANLEPNTPYQMIRIQLDLNKYDLYPEISVGRHRLTIHFFELTGANKSIQTKKDVEFNLACSKLHLSSDTQTQNQIDG